MFKIYCDKTRINIWEREAMTSGSSKIYDISLKFSDDWLNILSKVVVFSNTANGNTDKDISFIVEGNTCTIPWEVTQSAGETVYIGFYGIGDDGVRLPTVWGTLGRVEPGVAIGNPPTDKPDDIYDMFKKTLAEIKEISEDIQTAANNGEFNGEDGHTPYIGENGNWWLENTDTGVKAQGKNGVNGVTPQKGVDYFTSEDEAQMLDKIYNDAIKSRIKGRYNQYANYKIGDVVEYGGKFFVATTESIGVVPVPSPRAIHKYDYTGSVAPEPQTAYSNYFAHQMATEVILEDGYITFRTTKDTNDPSAKITDKLTEDGNGLKPSAVQYLAIKYRANIAQESNQIAFFLDKDGGTIIEPFTNHYCELVCDNTWRIAVIDMRAASKWNSVFGDSNDDIAAFRIDYYNRGTIPMGSALDLAWIRFYAPGEDLSEITPDSYVAWEELNVPSYDYLSTQIGDINTALDALHVYAETLAGGEVV